MRLDVGHRALGPTDRLAQDRYLLVDVGNQLFSRYVHVSTAETLAVPVRDVGTYDHARVLSRPRKSHA